MRYGYIRAKKLKEITQFEAEAKADTLLCDLSSSYNTFHNHNFEELLNSLQPNDTLVLKSIFNAVNDDINKEWGGIDKLYQLLKTCKEKEIQLESLKEEDNVLLTILGFEKVIKYLPEILKPENKSNEKPKRPFKGYRYPRDFLNYYNRIQREKEDNTIADKMNYQRAARELGITVDEWFKLVQEFRS